MLDLIKNHMRGFSLIELMIVITITSLLAAVAIPAYQDYVTRAKVTNMLAIAQSSKLSVTESLIAGTKPEIEKMTNHDVVKEISLVGNVITITGDSEKLGIRPKEKVLKISLTPDLSNPGLILWKCTVEPAEFKKYMPSDCRESTGGAPLS